MRTRGQVCFSIRPIDAERTAVIPTEARVYLIIYAAGFLGGLASVASRCVEKPPDRHFWRHLAVYPGVAGVIASTLTGLGWWGLAGEATPDPIAGPLVASCVGLSGIQIAEVGKVVRGLISHFLRLKTGLRIEIEDEKTKQEEPPRDT